MIKRQIIMVTSSLIEICISNNLFILNGRFGSDSTKGRLTFRDQSLINYTICSFNCLKLLADFEVIDTDFLISDGHALLLWSVSTIYHNDNISTEQVVETHKQWDKRLANYFKCNIPLNKIDDLYTKLKPTDSSIKEITSQLANILTKAAKVSFPIIIPRNAPKRTHTGCLKKRGPFLKLMPFLYFSRNLSKILYGHSKMIRLCSEEDSIYSSTSTGSDVIMTSNCTHDIIFFSSSLFRTQIK